MTILTDMEIAEIALGCALKSPSDIDFARAIEAAILEKIGEPVGYIRPGCLEALIDSPITEWAAVGNVEPANGGVPLYRLPEVKK